MGLQSVMHYKNGKAVKILCVLGAAIGILEVILSFFQIGSGPYAGQWATLDPLLEGIVFGIICILVCVVLLASFDVIDVKLRVVPSWLVLIILGIVIVLFGALYGGVLVLIGALIGTIDAL